MNYYIILIILIVLTILILLNKKKHFLNNRYCVVQFDNRSIIPDNLKKLLKMNKEHCDKNNITYIFINNENDLPPYWKKVELVLRFIKTNKYDYIIWLDSDALINVKNNVFNFIIDKMNNKDIIISKDMPPWNEKFNAGVWCVKNSSLTQNILTEWFSYYDKTVPNEETRGIVKILDTIYNNKKMFKEFQQNINKNNLGSESIILFRKI